MFYVEKIDVMCPPGYILIEGFKGCPNHYTISWESERVIIFDVEEDGVHEVMRWGAVPDPDATDHILLSEAQRFAAEHKEAA